MLFDKLLDGSPIMVFAHAQAVEYAQTIPGASIPSQEQLMLIYSHPVLRIKYALDCPRIYWSSTLRPNGVVVLNFETGDIDIATPYMRLYVRPILGAYLDILNCAMEASSQENHCNYCNYFVNRQEHSVTGVCSVSWSFVSKQDNCSHFAKK